MTKTFVQNPRRYAGQPRRKDYYDTVYQRFQKEKISRVLDVGTASGDFLYFMPESIRGVGIDKSKELIATAKKPEGKETLLS